MKNNQMVTAMAFYHRDGLVPAWRHAMRFAGNGGRIAILPDIISARTATELGSIAWEKYMVTLTAEYIGRSRGGSKIVIVAQGIGPMSTLKGILKAYKLKREPIRGRIDTDESGRISRDEFLKLESGTFGPVEIIDLEAVKKWEYRHMTLKEATDNPLVRARLGTQWEKYLEKHQKFAREFSRKHNPEYINDPMFLQMAYGWEYIADHHYEHGELINISVNVPNYQAIAHLIMIEPPFFTHFREAPPGGCLCCNVGCHGKTSGVRLVAIKEGSGIPDIYSVGDTENILNGQKDLENDYDMLLAFAKNTIFDD